MADLLAYIAPLVAFLAALVALLGPSRNRSVPGLAGLSRLGWLSFGLAAISLAAALYGIHSRQQELAAARSEAARIRAVAYDEIGEGLGHINRVLRYAALLPFAGNAPLAEGAPRDVSYWRDGNPLAILSFDPQSAEALVVFEHLYLSPRVHLNGVYTSPIPFGTDVRPAMDIMAEESARARQTIEFAIQKYAAKAISADVFEAASAVVGAPYLKHLMALRESWHERSQMEDSIHPQSLKFLMVGSGVGGDTREDYLAFVEAMDRLRQALSAIE
jgi:hypothetical protein